MQMPQFTETVRTAAALKTNIPKKRWQAKTRSMVWWLVGAVVFFGRMFVEAANDVPWPVVCVAVGFCGFSANKERTVKFFKLLPAVIKDVLNAFKSGD